MGQENRNTTTIPGAASILKAGGTMLGKTHLMAGIATGAALSTLTGNPIPAIAVTGIASLVPDVDEPHSLLGRRLPVLAWPIKLIFGHRTVTHTVEFALMLSLITTFAATVWVSWPHNLYLGLFVLAGMLSHILLDCLTKGGVALFMLKPDLHISGPFRTGSIFDYFLLLVFLSSIVKILS